MQTIVTSLVKDNGVSLEQAKAALKGWEIRPIERNGHKYGEYMIQQNEVHFALNKEDRLKIGRVQLMRKVLSEMLEGRDFLVTSLFKHDKNQKLIEMFGFILIHEDQEHKHFWLDKETCKCLL